MAQETENIVKKSELRAVGLYIKLLLNQGTINININVLHKCTG